MPEEFSVKQRMVASRRCGTSYVEFHSMKRPACGPGIGRDAGAIQRQITAAACGPMPDAMCRAAGGFGPCLRPPCRLNARRMISGGLDLRVTRESPAKAACLSAEACVQLGNGNGVERGRASAGRDEGDDKKAGQAPCATMAR